MQVLQRRHHIITLSSQCNRPHEINESNCKSASLHNFMRSTSRSVRTASTLNKICNFFLQFKIPLNFHFNEPVCMGALPFTHQVMLTDEMTAAHERDSQFQ